ncbi:MULTISPECIES: hypothetical protein [Vibrio]|uniref:hypothetical protein n=1 Tax=Vibrio TaxID=662 RepID=UPI0002E9C655|nr:hypothetical protein [Vibrio crassostreae]OED76214.1 hypothetical protein A141_21970 [Vibrio crassostreae ZF-91]
MEDLDVKIVVTIIAALVSFVGLIIAKDHKISEFRQSWINDFRSDLGDLMGCLSNIAAKFMLATEDQETKKIDGVKFIESAHELYNEAHRLIYKLKLMLNPEKDLELINSLEAVENLIMCRKKMADSAHFAEVTDALYSLSHKTLKNEWSRVKKGEIVFQSTKWLLAILVGIFASSYLVELYATLTSVN